MARLSGYSVATLAFFVAFVAMPLAVYTLETEGLTFEETVQNMRSLSLGPFHQFSWYFLVPPTLMGPWVVYRYQRALGRPRILSWGGLWAVQGVCVWSQAAAYLGPRRDLICILYTYFIAVILFAATPVAFVGLLVQSIVRKRPANTWGRFNEVDALSIALTAAWVVRCCVSAVGGVMYPLHAFPWI